jgi:hypothetical protein
MANIEADKRVSNDIRQHGLHVIHVLADEIGPRFSYSIGLFESYKHPEIIIVGLKQELSHTLINSIAENIKNGISYLPFNYYPDILNDFECYFTDVSLENYDSYVGQAQRYYNSDDFPLLQCIYPTVKGFFPWDADWPEGIKDLQPILGEIING